MKLLVFASVLTVGLCMPGGWTDQDPSKQEFADIIDELQLKGKINLQGRANGSYPLVAVQTQVVAGMNYKFTFNVGDHQCYIIYFEQVWTSTQTIMNDTCKTMKRQLGGVVLGGYKNEVPTQQKFADLLTQLQTLKLIQLPTLTNGGPGFQILAVQTQVVAGINYKFTLSISGHTCMLTAYVRTWDTHYEITGDTCNIKVQAQTRQLAGGWSPVTDTSDSGVQACLGASLDRVNMGSNDMYRLVDSNIISIEQQVVSGMKYRFTIQVSESVCTNQGPQYLGMTSAKCALNMNSGMLLTYHGECMYQAWMPDKTIVLSMVEEKN